MAKAVPVEKSRQSQHSHLTKRLFLCGDVMIGRGIDQIMRSPVTPEIFEPYLKDARDYVSLAEQVSGAIPRNVPPDYIWGELLSQIAAPDIDARIINLETSVTKRGAPWPGKGIQYRVAPSHLDCLKAAHIDCCELANNHVLDWGYQGLEDTLTSLEQAGIHQAGAGATEAQATAPAILSPAPDRSPGRVLVFAYGLDSSGVPESWAAKADRPGVNYLHDLSDQSVERVAQQIRTVRQSGDIIVAGLHWGPNWGFDLPAGHRDFAHKLVDQAGIDILHGHSSHHVTPIEIYRNKLILYGCGDLLNDYEGIGQLGAFRADLGLMYFPTLNAHTGDLEQLVMIPTHIRRFQITSASDADTVWLTNCLNNICAELGTRITSKEGQLTIS